MRRSAPDQWDVKLDQPSIAALSAKPDEDGISIYAQLLMKTRDLEPAVLVERKSRHGVFSFPAGVSELTECSVTHEPDDNEPGWPEDFAHGLIRISHLTKPRWQQIRLALILASRVEVRPAG